MNILFCSVGRRCELLKNFRNSLTEGSKIVVTDMSNFAPALAFADEFYIVPSIKDDNYIEIIKDICLKENIHAITTLIDPEIEILSYHRKDFEEIGVEVLLPYYNTAKLCFDKYKLYAFFEQKGICVVPTYGTFDEVNNAINEGKLQLPVFVKPRTGSGSVGARKISTLKDLKEAFELDESLIAQRLMNQTDLDADVYIDTISHKPVSIFTKRKLETKIGGASKTISFHDNKLVEFIKKIVGELEFNGPIDIDFFELDGEYYLSEINPRFGGAYLHAYGAGVDFIKLIENNINKIENKEKFNNYEENIVMMMYDSVVIKKFDKKDM